MRIYLGRPFKGEPCFQGKSSSGKPFFPIRAYHCSFFFFSRKLSFQESLFFWRTFFRRAFFRRIFFFQPDLFQGHLVFRGTFFQNFFSRRTFFPENLLAAAALSRLSHLPLPLCPLHWPPMQQMPDLEMEKKTTSQRVKKEEKQKKYKKRYKDQLNHLHKNKMRNCHFINDECEKC